MSFASQGRGAAVSIPTPSLTFPGLVPPSGARSGVILGPTILIGLLTLIVVQVITPNISPSRA